nr:hypothetical protein [Sphingobium sp.]
MSIENSPEEEGLQKAPSVYDFVYVDVERIASILSQFDDNGHLIKQTTGSSSRNTRSGEASVPGVVKGRFDQGADMSVGREYDPAWLAPLNFLDELNCRSMIERDIATAKLGQFVLMSGKLHVTDLQLLAGMWENPTIRKTMVQQATSETGDDESRQVRRSKQRNGNKEAISEAEMAMSVIGLMPHYLQTTIGSFPECAWCNLDPKHMRIPLGDFALKHGAFIPGRWHALGILDALPEGDEEDYNVPVQNVLGNAYLQLAHPVRFMMGRPYGTAYGITPILLFRQVNEQV